MIKFFFSIYDVSDLTDNKLSRGYIRSDDKIWDLWRKLVLPKISYLSILKLVSNSWKQGKSKTTFLFQDFIRLTPREAARLQGFPDTFRISVSDNQAYQQFGNSVPVKVVEKVAEQILKHIKIAKEEMHYAQQRSAKSGAEVQNLNIVNPNQHLYSVKH